MEATSNLKNREKKIKKIRNFLVGFFALIVLIIIFIYRGNNSIQTTYLNLKNSKVNNKIKIVHISDLHEKIFGKNNETLIKKIKQENPDLIFITGDVACFSDEHMKILDEKSVKVYNENLRYISDILKKIQPIAPTFFSLGNHELVFQKFDYGFANFKMVVQKTNTILLINQAYSLDVGNTTVNIFGAENSYYQDIKINELVKVFEKRKGLKIILDHYPVDFNLNGEFSYTNYNIDYVFSGHEHGGQVRIPFIGGMFSHEEGFLPKYSEGVHTIDNHTLIISRGLGDSILHIRVFNRPELIVLELN